MPKNITISSDMTNSNGPGTLVNTATSINHLASNTRDLSSFFPLIQFFYESIYKDIRGYFLKFLFNLNSIHEIKNLFSLRINKALNSFVIDFVEKLLIEGTGLQIGAFFAFTEILKKHRHFPNDNSRSMSSFFHVKAYLHSLSLTVEQNSSKDEGSTKKRKSKFKEENLLTVKARQDRNRLYIGQELMLLSNPLLKVSSKQADNKSLLNIVKEEYNKIESIEHNNFSIPQKLMMRWIKNSPILNDVELNQIGVKFIPGSTKKNKKMSFDAISLDQLLNEELIFTLDDILKPAGISQLNILEWASLLKRQKLLDFWFKTYIEMFDKKNVLEMTKLHFAVLCNQGKEIIESLINENPTLLYKKDKNGNIPLHYAIITGNLQLVQLLLASMPENQTPKVINFYIKNKQNYTFLNLACKHGYLEIARLLIQLADKSLLSQDYLTLHNDMFCSSLKLAFEGGYLTIAELLLENKNKVDFSKVLDYQFLITLCEKGYLTILQLLNQNKIDFTDEQENTILTAACTKGYLPLVKFLLDKRPKPSIATLLQEKDFIISASIKGHIEVVKFLIERGADINKSRKGFTALHFASFENHLEMVKLLINNGADINKQSVERKGGTALDIASSKGNLEIVKFLLSNGAFLNKTKEMAKTPLQIASTFGQLDVVKFLIEKGADVNAVDEDGYTALNYAFQKGHLHVQEFLQNLSGNKKNSSSISNNSYETITASLPDQQPVKDELDNMLQKRKADQVEDLNESPTKKIKLNENEDEDEKTEQMDADESKEETRFPIK